MKVTAKKHYPNAKWRELAKGIAYVNSREASHTPWISVTVQGTEETIELQLSQAEAEVLALDS